MKGEYHDRARYGILVVLLFVVCYLAGNVGVLLAHRVAPPPVVIEKNPFLYNSTIRTSELQGVQQFVASKNSDIFYPILCSHAQRIQEQNRVYFATEADAVRNGFVRSAQCLEQEIE